MTITYYSKDKPVAEGRYLVTRDPPLRLPLERTHVKKDHKHERYILEVERWIK